MVHLSFSLYYLHDFYFDCYRNRWLSDTFHFTSIGHVFTLFLSLPFTSFFFVSWTCVLHWLFIHAASLHMYAVFHAFTLPYTWDLILYKLVVVQYYTLACSLLVLQSTWILLEHWLSVLRQTPSENSGIDLNLEHTNLYAWLYLQIFEGVTRTT